jgi:O-antigen/teichoic acid export membrane protein
VARRDVEASSGAWSRLFENALTVAIAGGFANLLNLATTFFIARLLAPSSYGAYSQLIGVYFVVALPGSALGVAVVRRAGYYIVRGDHVLTMHWQRRLHRRIRIAAIISALVALPLSIAAAQWLGHRSWVAVWLVAVAGLIFAVLSVDRALLQSQQRYFALAQNFAFEGVARLVFTLAGVTAGVTGFALGLVAAEAVTRWHAYRMVRTKFEVDHGIEIEHTGITSELAIALVTLGLMAVLQFVDVFVIGHSNSAQAGGYTAISQVAKTIVYGAAILSSFLLPEAVLASRRHVDSLRQMCVVLGLLALPAVGLLIIANNYAEQLLKLVFGARYSGAHAALPTLLYAMIALAVSTILVTYLLGDGARWPTAWIGVCTIVGVYWVNGGHGQWQATATRDLQLQLVTMAGLFVASAHRMVRSHRMAVA